MDVRTVRRWQAYLAGASALAGVFIGAYKKHEERDLIQRLNVAQENERNLRELVVHLPAALEHPTPGVDLLTKKLHQHLQTDPAFAKALKRVVPNVEVGEPYGWDVTFPTEETAAVEVASVDLETLLDVKATWLFVVESDHWRLDDVRLPRLVDLDSPGNLALKTRMPDLLRRLPQQLDAANPPNLAPALVARLKKEPGLKADVVMATRHLTDLQRGSGFVDPETHTGRWESTYTDDFGVDDDRAVWHLRTEGDRIIIDDVELPDAEAAKLPLYDASVPDGPPPSPEEVEKARQQIKAEIEGALRKTAH